ncbi:phosphate ABC transporter substrate-binding/OmpA family protein [Tropicimonas sp. TH_r6]|nr:phosphate ABC transporter substrate-binding/OmpA family protein [Tropicimonas sp. TH_r6]
MLGFDGAFYRLRTDFGVITLDAEGVYCEGPGCPDLIHPIAEIRFSGEASVGDILLPALLETFAARSALLAKRLETGPDSFSYHLVDPTEGRLVGRFHFSLNDSTTGIADLIADRADLAMANRIATADEIAEGKKAGFGDLTAPRRARIVALDGLVPVVSPHNPIRRISFEQLEAIRAGTLLDWAGLGGTAAPIDLHEPVSDGSVEQILPSPKRSPGKDSQGWLVRHESGAGLVDTVARSPDALGLARFSDLGNARPLELTGNCGRQISLSREALKSEDYPLPLPLYLYVPPRRLPLLAREFLDWLNTPAAGMAVRRAGYVDQIAVEIPLAAQGERLANAIAAAGDEVQIEDLKAMVGAMVGAQRLTSTFRFQNGSTQLDPQSEGNLDRLARQIEIGSYDNREILLAGFSDGLGPAETNQALSLKRAEVVAEALRLAAPLADWNRVVLSAVGFGEALPLACDDHERGRKTNRRVEVWLR